MSLFTPDHIIIAKKNICSCLLQVVKPEEVDHMLDDIEDISEGC